MGESFHAGFHDDFVSFSVVDAVARGNASPNSSSRASAEYSEEGSDQKGKGRSMAREKQGEDVAGGGRNGHVLNRSMVVDNPAEDGFELAAKPLFKVSVNFISRTFRIN